MIPRRDENKEYDPIVNVVAGVVLVALAVTVLAIFGALVWRLCDWVAG